MVAGKQSLHKIPHLAGKNVFRGLSQRPVMQSEAETHQRLKDCFDARVGGAVRSSIQDITALEAPPGQQPLALAFSRVTPLKWTPPVSEAPAPAPDTSVQASTLHTLYKQGSRWHCRTCGCTASAQQKAAFATAPCHGDLAHVFKAEGPRSKQHKCLHCCVVATGQADLVRLQALPCPKLCRSSAPRPDPHGADSAAAPARPPVVKPPPELHHPVQCGSGWKCANCPLSCPTKGALARFKKARCLGDRAHSYEQRSGSTSWTCSKCGDVVASAKQLQGKVAHPCPGASRVENSFQHELTPEPDADGKFRCKRCGRASVKNSLQRFRKTLCYGSNATTRAKAIEATRAVHGLSHSQVLPEDVMTQLAHLRQSSVTLDGGSPHVRPPPWPD